MRAMTIRASSLIVFIPLVLSAFTHLFNPGGFPCLHADEAKYVRRALYVLDGLGPQDPSSRFDHAQGSTGSSTSSYDHPHFGQIFLAGMFKIIGYPSSLNPSSSIGSIEMLYVVPRVIMGLLAVLDTFLIYKIVERRYNTKTGAFIASTLFAVMPVSWLMRRIYLDSILMPFVLSSILFAIYLARRKNDIVAGSDDINDTDGNSSVKKLDIKNILAKNNEIILTLVSGILLGLAIYTKVPAITIIPVVGFLVFTNTRKWKMLGLWLIPVVFIPLLWPAYALSVGQFDEWLDGVFWQATERGQVGLSSTIRSLILMDPVLATLGIIGIVFAALKRDYFILLWVITFLIFSYIVQWTLYFHFILLLPIICIASAVIIVDISNKIFRKRDTYKKLVPFAVISIIGIFGLASTMLIITTNVFFEQITHVALAVQEIEDNRVMDEITVVSAPEYSWLFKYIFNTAQSLQTRDSSQIKEDKVLLMVDRSYFAVTSKNPQNNELEDPIQVEKLLNIYNNTHPVVLIDDSYKIPGYYPYSNVKDCRSEGLQVRTNY
jgi:4-amino-4-deoxy-L-arabinose transferase-like glycosyltransferase